MRLTDTFRVAVGGAYADAELTEDVASAGFETGARSGNYVKVDLAARRSVRNFDIDLFVRNLLNEDAFTFRTKEDRGEYHGFRLRPGTIGVQLGYNF